jgi:hypothetical protein
MDHTPDKSPIRHPPASGDPPSRKNDRFGGEAKIGRTTIPGAAQLADCGKELPAAEVEELMRCYTSGVDPVWWTSFRLDRCVHRDCRGRDRNCQSPLSQQLVRALPFVARGAPVWAVMSVTCHSSPLFPALLSVSRSFTVLSAVPCTIEGTAVLWHTSPIAPTAALWGFPCCVRFPRVRAAATTPVQRLGVVLAHLTQP